MSNGTKSRPCASARRFRNWSNICFQAAAWSVAVAVSTPSMSNRTASKFSRVISGNDVIHLPLVAQFTRVGGSEHSRHFSRACCRRFHTCHIVRRVDTNQPLRSAEAHRRFGDPSTTLRSAAARQAHDQRDDCPRSARRTGVLPRLVGADVSGFGCSRPAR